VTNPEGGKRFDAFAVAALAVHIVLALSLRSTAWPEVTTPGYLWSRGWLMYRDIKLLHTPGTTGTLALGFLAFGPSTWFLRAYAAFWPLVGHFFLLRETRRFSLFARVCGSAFFLVVFFLSEGNAVWPTVVMTAFAIPIAGALSRRRMVEAGLLIGIAILFKQTAAYLLMLSALVLLLDRRVKETLRLVAVACAPYFAVLAVFAALGAATDMLRWTVVVPFLVGADIAQFDVGPMTIVNFIATFLPLAVDAWLERPGEREVSSRWLLVVAVGLAAIAFPRFNLMNAVGAVPCLALGAARLMSRPNRAVAVPAAAFVLVLTISRGAILFAGSEFDGRVRYWNENPNFNALIERLRQLPPDTRIRSELWGNVLPRAERLPPGDVYQHTWLYWFLPIDHTGERMQAALAKPGTVIVKARDATSKGEIVGPYVIVRR
jgi:hypothetical protein